MADGVCEEKTVVFCEISLVVSGIDVEDSEGSLMTWGLVWAFVGALDVIGDNVGALEGLGNENTGF